MCRFYNGLKKYAPIHEFIINPLSFKCFLHMKDIDLIFCRCCFIVAHTMSVWLNKILIYLNILSYSFRRKKRMLEGRYFFYKFSCLTSEIKPDYQ